MYANKGVIGGLASDLYWSSSEMGANDAIFQNFGTFNRELTPGKSNSYDVRPVRAF
jgi:hypothetical protein